MSQMRRALVMLALSVALAATTTTVGAQPSPPTIEDQFGPCRRLEGKLATREQADRERAAVELFRCMERNLDPAPGSLVPVQPAAPRGTATPRRGVDLVASLLLGLVGGVVGGSAAMAAWTVATRRRRHRTALSPDPSATM